MARERGGGGELTRGIGRLWKGCGKRGYKPLSRTITIHAINLSLGPVTRIMRAVRVSASITFEIPYGLGLTPPPRLLLIALTHVIFLFFHHRISAHDHYSISTISFLPWHEKKDLCDIFDEFFFSLSCVLIRQLSDFDLFTK